jgi:polyisoprenyl-teichoic acid--peptidoglycan teichoic acid transferase
VSPRRAVFLGLAGIGVSGCLVAGFVLVRLWTFVHAVAPRAGVKEVIALVGNQIAPTTTPTAGMGRVNFALLGYGGPGHDGPYLTDTMMVVSAQTDTKQLAMISIPRDLWIPIPTNNSGLNWTTKINGAYTVGIRDDLFPSKDPAFRGPLGGGDLASEMVHRVTGLPIPYWIAVDFTGFRQVVDAVGGIDLVVPQALDDPLYPQGDTTGYMHIHFNPGLQHMDGERALEYARSRETTSDFDRSRRQQLIVLAVRHKVLSVDGIPRLFGVLDALQDHFRTNMTLLQMDQFAQIANRLQDTATERISLDNTNFLYSTFSSDGQYILLPYDRTYAALHRYLDQLFPDPLVPVESTPVQILNGFRWRGGPRSPADLLTQLLGWVGLTTLPPGEAASHGYAHTVILDYEQGQDTLTLDYLTAFFNAQVMAQSGPSPGAPIVVVLGLDPGVSFAQTRR